MSRYDVYITRKALKQLDELGKHSRNRILEALITLRDYGFTTRLDIRKLRGYKNHYGIRVGKHSIFFELEKSRKIIVYAILTRGEAYK